ncbi:response regulator transcription factor [Sutterella sp.]|uniref:response regulator transcription factor n=1 Tax=Sutterella sp. TaxID=1981025 RepID=UPI0026E0C4AB|nr:response regulator [Sutterella sp.]MDO5531316.1 response regulator [Sutterella sp.]
MLSSYDYTNELPGDNRNGLVYVIDDDADVRESIKWLLESTHYRVEDYESGETFIAQFNENVPSVILCDLRMPGMSGADVQDHLLRRRIDAPFIFITGHGDVPQAVQAFKRGAMDFIQKPFQQPQLQKLVERAMRTAKELFSRRQMLVQNRALIEKLTPREQQVLERIVNGRLNKQIADDLGISIKTVEAHRASIMDKTGSGTVADLMRVVVKSELYPKISATLAEAVAALPSRLAETGIPHTEESAEHERRLENEFRESEAERDRADADVSGDSFAEGEPSDGGKYI